VVELLWKMLMDVCRLNYYNHNWIRARIDWNPQGRENCERLGFRKCRNFGGTARKSYTLLSGTGPAVRHHRKDNHLCVVARILMVMGFLKVMFLLNAGLEIVFGYKCWW